MTRSGGIPNFTLIPAQGFSVPAVGSAGVHYNLVVHLTATGPLPVGFDAVRIAYTRNGRNYVQDGTTSFRVERAAC